MNKKLIIILLLAVLAFLLYAWLRPPTVAIPDKEVREAGTFEECVKEGNPIEESWPPVCRTKSGKVLTQNIGNEIVLRDKIRIDTPRPISKVTNPLSIKGEARGSWFFEASFTANILDQNGVILGTGIMTAEGEWMTEEFVPFSGELVFDTPTGERGELVLQKNNPSGLPEHDESLIVPVRFK
jgi:hypothetical protein